MTHLRQDLRFAVRTMKRTPIFTAVAILSLALGIGANTAIFTLMDQVLLRALPVQDPEELVLLDQPGPNQGSIRDDYAFSYPMYTAIRDRNPVFTSVLARYSDAVSITHNGQTQRVFGELVSGNYFQVLGVRAAHGRTLLPEDDGRTGGNPVTVLTHDFWRRKFGGDTRIIGQTVRINGFPMTVAGIGPPGFHGVQVGSPVDLWAPMMLKPRFTPTWNDLDNPRSMWLNIYGRLKPGLEREQARVGLQVLYKQLLDAEVEQIPNRSEFFRKRFVGKQIQLLPGASGQSELRTQFRKPLLVLMGMVGLVLLIACANVANLLVARAAAREREVAIRLAVGASRWQIVRQLVVESAVLSIAGGALGLLIAMWAGDLLIGFLPFEGARQVFTTLPDLRVLGFALASCVVSALLFGLVPAIQAARPQLARTLKNEAGNLSSGAGQVRFRKGLVVAQISLSLLLLIGSGLFARSLYNLRSMNPGFSVENMLSFSLNPALNGYPKERILQAFDQLQTRIESLPGVRSASMAEVGVMSGSRSRSSVNAEGYKAKDGEDISPDVNWVGPKFFTTMGVRMLAGREFTPADGPDSPKVGIVNETMARYFFGSQDPIGRKFAFGGKKTPDIEIVGLVADTRTQGLRDKPAREVYVPYTQNPKPAQLTFYVRTAQAPADMGRAVRREIQKLDGALPVFDMKTVETQLSESLFTERMIAILSAFFGLLATVLAAVGLYGVMAFTVVRRTREIGIRMALGAARNDVLGLVMKEVVLLAAIGIAIGLPGAFGIGRYLETQLFGLDAHDPLTLSTATLVLLGVALLAGLIPASRASRVDPMRALRYD